MSLNAESQDGLHSPAERELQPTWRRLWTSRELIMTLVKRDLKVRYKSSALGFLWSFGKPLLLMLVIWAVFSNLVKIAPPHPELPYALHLLTGLLPWMFFQAALSDSLFSVIGNQNLIKKVWMPSEVFPAAALLGQLIHFLLALSMLALFIVAYSILGARVYPNWEILLLPLLIVFQAFLMFGIMLILSSLNVFYRDVSSLAEVFLTAWFYLTPIIYGMNFVRVELYDRGANFFYWLYLLNPMTPIVVAYRRIIYGPLFDEGPEISDLTLGVALSLSGVTAVIAMVIGVHLFRRLSRKFADEL